MARGAPDYSNIKVGDPIHRLDDMAELAARLTSINTFDRAGNVVWITDFESGLQGTVCGVDDAASTGALSVERAYHGNYSVKLDPQGASGAYANWARVIQFVLTGKVGAEIAVSTDADPLYITLWAYYMDGTTCQRGGLRYDPSTGNWDIGTVDGTWTNVLAGHKIQQGAGAWHNIKLVIDAKTGKYVRAIISKEVVILSEYDLYSYSYGGLGQLFVKFQIDGSAAKHAAVWLDSVIVTQNEP